MQTFPLQRQVEQMAVNTELCSKDRAALPPSLRNSRPIWMESQDEVAGVKSDKVSMDGGDAGSDDDGHLRPPRQVNHLSPLKPCSGMTTLPTR